MSGISKKIDTPLLSRPYNTACHCYIFCYETLQKYSDDSCRRATAAYCVAILDMTNLFHRLSALLGANFIYCQLKNLFSPFDLKSVLFC